MLTLIQGQLNDPASYLILLKVWCQPLNILFYQKEKMTMQLKRIYRQGWQKQIFAFLLQGCYQKYQHKFFALLKKNRLGNSLITDLLLLKDLHINPDPRSSFLPNH